MNAVPLARVPISNKSGPMLALHQEKNAIAGLNVLSISEAPRVCDVTPPKKLPC